MFTGNVTQSNYNVQSFTSKHELISVRILIFWRPSCKSHGLTVTWLNRVATWIIWWLDCLTCLCICSNTLFFNRYLQSHDALRKHAFNLNCVYWVVTRKFKSNLVGCWVDLWHLQEKSPKIGFRNSTSWQPFTLCVSLLF